MTEGDIFIVQIEKIHDGLSVDMNRREISEDEYKKLRGELI